MFAGQILEMFGARLPALGLSNKAIDAGDEPEEDHWEEAAFQANPIDLAGSFNTFKNDSVLRAS